MSLLPDCTCAPFGTDRDADCPRHGRSNVLSPTLPGDVRQITSDAVNHPAHYTAGKVECIDALEAATSGLQGIEAVCTANAIKYLWRWKLKGGKQDLEKARWYLDRLIGGLS